MLETIDRWEVTQLAYLMDRLQAVDDGEGTLLDNTLIFFSSEIEDGNSHRHYNLPIILGGGAGGAVSSGRHIQYENEPIANLFISILGMVGVDIESFGDNGTGPIGQLT